LSTGTRKKRGQVTKRSERDHDREPGRARVAHEARVQRPPVVEVHEVRAAEELAHQRPQAFTGEVEVVVLVGSGGRKATSSSPERARSTSAPVCGRSVPVTTRTRWPSATSSRPSARVIVSVPPWKSGGKCGVRKTISTVRG
jgi:hypothetical protein